jgi:hypothetical protein
MIPTRFSRPLHASAIALAALLLALASPAWGQLQVDIGLKRTLYIAYEPLIVNVSIKNLTGNALELYDSDGQHWFGFQIETLDGRPIATRSSSYTNAPLVLEAGQKLTRAVNLTPLYPIAEYGGYRISASIYAPTLKRYFNSPPLNVEITEGRPVFEKTVGVPANEKGGGEFRKITLLTHRLPNSSQLYLRIENTEKRTVYCTHRLGRIVSYGTPDVVLDKRNQIHVLQNVAPKAFLYSHIGLNGEVLDRKTYQQGLKRPALRELPDGTISVIGAQVIDPTAVASEQPVPSLSDRPVPLPNSTTDSTPKDEVRPKNLLSR